MAHCAFVYTSGLGKLPVGNPRPIPQPTNQGCKRIPAILRFRVPVFGVRDEGDCIHKRPRDLPDAAFRHGVGDGSELNRHELLAGVHGGHDCRRRGRGYLKPPVLVPDDVATCLGIALVRRQHGHAVGGPLDGLRRKELCAAAGCGATFLQDDPVQHGIAPLRLANLDRPIHTTSV